ncbi:MAG: LysM peptidoglycan-binding domain-containing protein, partial [Candidatus Omnitrophica bacterium]|nr:LysM peptidoglycan-binding domain-containing protein [Candidatus Omnitrophota bacterium]
MLKRILMLMVVLVLVLGFSTAFAADEITVTGTDATANSASENVSQTVSRPSAEVQAQTSNVIMTEAEKTDPSKIFPGVESTNSSISVALPAEIQILIQNGKLLQARTELLKLWNATTDPALKDESEIALSDVNSRLLFSANENFPGMIEYRVKPGDSLYIIAKKNKTSAHMIQMINGLKSDMI